MKTYSPLNRSILPGFAALLLTVALALPATLTAKPEKPEKPDAAGMAKSKGDAEAKATEAKAKGATKAAEAKAKADGKAAEPSAEAATGKVKADQAVGEAAKTDAKALEKQAEKKTEQERKELGKGSEQGQAKRAENSRKWWKFWGGEKEAPAAAPVPAPAK
jgi:uncharacterized protein with gpF-like domain